MPRGAAVPRRTETCGGGKLGVGERADRHGDEAGYPGSLPAHRRAAHRTETETWPTRPLSPSARPLGGPALDRHMLVRKARLRRKRRCRCVFLAFQAMADGKRGPARPRKPGEAVRSCMMLSGWSSLSPSSFRAPLAASAARTTRYDVPPNRPGLTWRNWRSVGYQGLSSRPFEPAPAGNRSG